MKIQFEIAGILRFMTFLAVMMASIGFVVRNTPMLSDGSWIPPMFVWAGPFWLPFVFGAYAVGRRALTWKCVLVFALSETAVIAAEDLVF